MSDVYKYEKRGWYPHLMPEDVAVWERFIEAYPDYYETVQYDVPVGRIPEFVKNEPDATMRAMEKLYKKKIDVLAESPRTFDIVELKPVCTIATVGQVNGYKHFYVRDEKPDREPRAVVICGAASEDVIEYAEEYGVTVLVV